MKLLIFPAGKCDLAIDVVHVREVIPAAALSAAVDADGSLEGLLNLRGSVVPVVDLQAYRNISQPPLSASDFLIIVADSQDRRFAVRANGEVEFVEGDDSVIESSQKTSAVGDVARVGHRIAEMLSPDKLSPHRSGKLNQQADGSAGL